MSHNSHWCEGSVRYGSYVMITKFEFDKFIQLVNIASRVHGRRGIIFILEIYGKITPMGETAH